MEIVNSNKKIKTNLRLLEKYTFFIPNYIVASPTEVYKGSWNLNKKYHGYGIKYEFNHIKNTDSRTEGTFNNGLLFGCGRIILSNGEIFFGVFSYGKMTGKGEYKREDGSKYEGQFLEGVPHGKGKEIMTDGSIFEGIYLGGIRKQGKITWKDGSSYEGYFENDKFSGSGKYNWGNQRQYEGEWKDGKMNGKGKLTYSDGSYSIRHTQVQGQNSNIFSKIRGISPVKSGLFNKKGLNILKSGVLLPILQIFIIFFIF